MTKLVEDKYTRNLYEHIMGKELVPRYWHPIDEDFIFCECPARPEYSAFYFYLSLENFTIIKDNNETRNT